MLFNITAPNSSAYHMFTFYQNIMWKVITNKSINANCSLEFQYNTNHKNWYMSDYSFYLIEIGMNKPLIWYLYSFVPFWNHFTIGISTCWIKAENNSVPTCYTTKVFIYIIWSLYYLTLTTMKKDTANLEW